MFIFSAAIFLVYRVFAVLFNIFRLKVKAKHVANNRHSENPPHPSTKATLVAFSISPPLMPVP